MTDTNKGKIMSKVEAEKAYIIETNNQNSMVISQQEKCINFKINFWVGKVFPIEYYICVPKGTIDTTFKIDLE